jgi:hypothetical protein
MNSSEIISIANAEINKLVGYTVSQFTIEKPKDLDDTQDMLSVISKMSPLVGNMLEFKISKMLSAHPELGKLGIWKRQDPDFPDVLFNPNADNQFSFQLGYEVKGWYPLATEITGRFKDSQLAFINDEIYVIVAAWLPDKIWWGKPKILKLGIVSAKEIAASRDLHYHNPPDYIIIEPNNTSDRKKNTQQRNTSGYKWQGGDIEEAKKMVESWGADHKKYKLDEDYQAKIKELKNSFSYRSDTNFGKIDRINDCGVEKFKADVLDTEFEGKTVKQWCEFLSIVGKNDFTRVLDNEEDIPYM